MHSSCSKIINSCKNRTAAAGEEEEEERKKGKVG